ncbi:ABC transporter substrate-binding protein [uncultured Paraburkholderia sp.]|uniref:ABC transporter substrate-binding protein n=1 Tax=uncultured Paraburkholderia sp. TaxID=1822466 RepID=UPI00259A1513|nr:ABC transporter substrate-binding protein [uncultured Paraburkholderia sp.]
MTLVALSIAAPVVAQEKIKIGFLTDMSGWQADAEGKDGVTSIQLAIDDFGGKVLNRPIELLYADHQAKSDIGATKAREWIDTRGVNVIFGGTNSAVGLALSNVTREKKTVYINISGITAQLTNEACSPYTVHYGYDTVALAKGTGSAVVEAGGKSWFFITADYAFGHSMQSDTTAVIKAHGGTVVGSALHPTSASDFSSQLMKAKGSNAQVLGLANATGDMVSTLKGAKEFGLNQTMKIAVLLVFLSDVHGAGLKTFSGALFTTPWYWDLDDPSRKFAQRFYEKTKRMPNDTHAADYSATITYLKAVQAAGTTDSGKVMATLKTMKINDFYAKGGYIRADGSMVHDMYLMQMKSPAESKQPWDYYKVVKRLKGDDVFTTKAESKCALWK